MSHLTKEVILEIQRETFANASDTFELTPTLASWRDLEIETVAWMRANVMQESDLVALLAPYESGWSAKLNETSAYDLAAKLATEAELATR